MEIEEGEVLVTDFEPSINTNVSETQDAAVVSENTEKSSGIVEPPSETVVTLGEDTKESSSSALASDKDDKLGDNDDADNSTRSKDRGARPFVQKPCHNFQRSGSCHRGSACHYAHVGPGGGSSERRGRDRESYQNPSYGMVSYSGGGGGYGGGSSFQRPQPVALPFNKKDLDDPLNFIKDIIPTRVPFAHLSDGGLGSPWERGLEHCDYLLQHSTKKRLLPKRGLKEEVETWGKKQIFLYNERRRISSKSVLHSSSNVGGNFPRHFPPPGGIGFNSYGGEGGRGMRHDEGGPPAGSRPYVKNSFSENDAPRNGRWNNPSRSGRSRSRSPESGKALRYRDVSPADNDRDYDRFKDRDSGDGFKGRHRGNRDQAGGDDGKSLRESSRGNRDRPSSSGSNWNRTIVVAKPPVVYNAGRRQSPVAPGSSRVVYPPHQQQRKHSPSSPRSSRRSRSRSISPRDGRRRKREDTQSPDRAPQRQKRESSAEAKQINLKGNNSGYTLFNGVARKEFPEPRPVVNPVAVNTTVDEQQVDPQARKKNLMKQLEELELQIARKKAITAAKPAVKTE